MACCSAAARSGKPATTSSSRATWKPLSVCPRNLFYGTGIPACILVMNKKGAAARKHVLFINADREYREGKAQNFLRPEDIDKIVHAYREKAGCSGLRPPCAGEEIDAEDYNCNIRRYVDNAPPPEPHDVRAHLHGGVPSAEIEALERFWQNYPGLREQCFVPRDGDQRYLDFAPAISGAPRDSGTRQGGRKRCGGASRLHAHAEIVVGKEPADGRGACPHKRAEGQCV